jgi:lysophospholipase L1-like esterase
MRLRIVLALSTVAGFVIVVTSAWTINELGKNNRAILHLIERVRTTEAERGQEIAAGFDALNRRIDRLRPGIVGHEHSTVREVIIAMQLARTKSPIVFLGDSITEAAILPDSICGHSVINAGIGGAGVDELLRVGPSLLKDKSPALVVLAVGTNDAYASPGQEGRFKASYVKLLQTLAPITPKVVVANIPPIDPKGSRSVAAGADAGLVNQLNLLLRKISEDEGVSLIDLNKAVGAEGAAQTIDGIHLAPSAYHLWDAAVLVGVKKALDCSS